MTNAIESLSTLINDAAIDYDTHRADNDRRDHSDDSLMHPFLRLCFDYTRAANLTLTSALTYSDPHISEYTNKPFSDRYYFSDSTFDDITNATAAIADAETLFSILHECAPAEYPDFAATIADNLDYLLDYDLDDLNITTLDELITELNSRFA